MAPRGVYQKLLLSGLGIVILLLVVLNTYYYFASKKLSTSTSLNNKNVPQEVKNKLDALTSDIKNNIKEQEHEVTLESQKFKEQCRLISNNPDNGAERSLRASKDVADYFYTLKVIKTEQITITKSNIPCNYIKLSLVSRVTKGPTITIFLPSGITNDIGIGKVSPLMYKKETGHFITMRLKIQNTTDPENPYKILEWQPIRSSIN